MTDTIPTPQTEGQRLARAMDNAIAELKIKIGEAADAERKYRKLKSDKYAEAAGMDVQAAAKTAWVDAQTADARYERDVADGMRSVLFQEVQNYRQQMSLVQTFARTDREEYDSYLRGQQSARMPGPLPWEESP